MKITGPITSQTLETLRNHMWSMGVVKGVLCIRTWPELLGQFESIPGFRAVEDYDVEELDNMLPCESGRVCGFHIVVRWNGAPIKSPSGQYRSEVVGGARRFCIDVEAQS